MSAENFASAIALVLVSEGGYVNNPSDPGGATNFGITIATLRSYRGRATSVIDVKALTRAEAIEIYRKNYWNTISADALPAGVDYAVFDISVNSGPGAAAKFLQECLKVVVDEHIGPLTIAAAKQAVAADLIRAICGKRLAFLQSLPTWSKFATGWKSRVARVQADALKLAGVVVPVLVVAEKPKPKVGPVAPVPVQVKSNWLIQLLRAVFAAVFPKGV